MKKTSKASARKPARKAPPAARKTAARRPVVPEEVSPEERHRMIAEAAYYRCLQRGPGGQDPEGDWLAAEKEIDQRLKSEGKRPLKAGTTPGGRSRPRAKGSAGSP